MAEFKINKFLHVNWDEIHRLSKELAEKLRDLGPWKGLVTVPRGGLMPACVVANELGLQLVETVCTIGYETDDMNPALASEVRVIKKPEAVDNEGEGWLLVDDMVDTGRTAAVLRNMMPKAHYAVLYAKPLGLPLVDTFVSELTQDTWVFFPWMIER